MGVLSLLMSHRQALDTYVDMHVCTEHALIVCTSVFSGSLKEQCHVHTL